MSTSVMSDATLRLTTETREFPPPATATARLTTETTEVESVNCKCCGLTEECTPEYIKRIRERYSGNWICGLCSEAVKYEIVRTERLISTEEAMARHVAFCRASISSNPAPDPTVCLIGTMRQILRRSLESVRSVKSVPCTPTMKRSSDVAGIGRSESCIPKLMIVVDYDCSACCELDEVSEGLKDWK